MGTSQSAVGGAFGSWSGIGGSIDLSGSPVAIITPGGELAMYGTDTDGNVYRTDQSSVAGPWVNWAEMA
jgi:hypothetical protein